MDINSRKRKLIIQDKDNVLPIKDPNERESLEISLKNLVDLCIEKGINSYFFIESLKEDERGWEGGYDWISNDEKYVILGGIETFKTQLIQQNCIEESFK